MCLSLKAAAYEHFRELALLRRARDRIDRELTLDIEALAASTGLPADQFCRRFQLAYGRSPHDYRRAARAFRAVRIREARATEPAVA